MRLDKFLCQTLGVTRREAGILLRQGEIQVDGKILKKAATQVDSSAKVLFKDQRLMLSGPRYFMLSKPEGFVCSHDDSNHPSALMLLDEVNAQDLHFAGRLDVDTTGLLLITDDGQWSHRITSPKHKCQKVYRVWLENPIEDAYQEKLQEGLLLRNEKKPTRPASMKVIDFENNELLLTIDEGKYHQVKRMFAALGNKVEYLHRESIGSIQLDPNLEPGEYRPLFAEEITSISIK